MTTAPPEARGQTPDPAARAASSPEPGVPDPAHLRARLDDERPSVRRIAVADLERSAPNDPTAAHLILDLAVRDPDDKTRILAIRALARLHYHPARPDLLALYEERSTPAPVAHAAILAHDTIRGRAAHAPA